MTEEEINKRVDKEYKRREEELNKEVRKYVTAIVITSTVLLMLAFFVVLYLNGKPT